MSIYAFGWYINTDHNEPEILGLEPPPKKTKNIKNKNKKIKTKQEYGTVNTLMFLIPISTC